MGDIEVLGFTLHPAAPLTSACGPPPSRSSAMAAWWICISVSFRRLRPSPANTRPQPLRRSLDIKSRLQLLQYKIFTLLLTSPLHVLLANCSMQYMY